MPNPKIAERLADLAAQPIYSQVSQLSSAIFPSRRNIANVIATRPAVLEIGSNGARLMLPNGESIRYSIRLASYVFNSKDERSRRPISKDGREQLHTVIALALQRCRATTTTHLCCVATSALREAPNRVTVQNEIRAKTGLAIQCISGELEAQLIALAISALAPKNKKFFAIDVGGGSIEVIACKDHAIAFKVSAALGSVTLKDLRPSEVTQRIEERMVGPLRKKLKAFIASHDRPQVAFVTGGNPQDLIRMATHRKSETVSLGALRRFAARLQKFSKQKLRASELKPDRLDVIKNASLALMHILKVLRVDKVTAPNAGLRSGVYRSVFGDLPFGLGLQTTKRLQEELKVLQNSYALVDTHCKMVQRTMIELLTPKFFTVEIKAFRPVALLWAAAALHDIGHSIIIAKGKHAERGAEFLAAIGITSLSKIENQLLCWLVSNHNNTVVTRPPAALGLGKKETTIALKLLHALRQAERMQHEHVL